MKRFLGFLATLLMIGIFGVLMILSPDDATLLAGLGLMVQVVVYVGVTSVYIIPADKMLAMFFLESYLGTYLPSRFAESRDENGQQMIDYPMAHRGLWGSSIVIRLWPFWHGVYIPQTSIELKLHATRVYTKDKGKTSPSLPIQAKASVVVLLAPDLRDFFHTFNVLGKGVDLATDCVIHDNLWKPNQEDKQAHTYRGPVIAAIMLRALESVILEATRKTGSRFPWRGTGNIKENKQDWEEALRQELARPESMMTRGGILVRHPDPRTGTAQLGNAVRAVDINIEDVDVEGEEARKALDRPMIETLEAEAQERKGDGEGRRIAKIIEKSGKTLTAREVLHADVAKGVKEVNAGVIGKSLMDAIGRIVGK